MFNEINFISVFKVIFSITLIVYLFLFLDTKSVAVKISNINPVWLFASLFCLIFAYILCGLRWAMICRGLRINISVARKIRLFFLGMFVSLFLPTSIGGDVIRGIFLAKGEGRKGIGFQAAASVLIDRLNGLYSLVVLITICLLFYNWPLLWWGLWLGIVFIMWACLFVFYLIHGQFHDLIPIKNAEFKELPINDKLFIQMWWRSFPLSIILFVLVIQAHVFLGVAVDLEMKWTQYAIMVGLVAFLTVLPISFNGFGIREISYIGIAGYFGADESAATAMAALWIIVMFLAATPGGWVLWKLGGMPTLKQKT